MYITYSNPVEKTSAEKQVEIMRDAAQKLLVLTENPEYGVPSWFDAVGQQLKRLKNVYEGNV